MKKIHITFISLISTICFSQNVTLDELIKLRKKDLATLEKQLTLKGQSYISGKELTSEVMGKATFAYNKGSYDDKAESFIKYMYSDSASNRIDIQIIRKEKYNTFLSRIKSLGCKLINSNISSGTIEKVQQGATLTFMISVSTKTNDFDSTSTIYHIFIFDNYDYKFNFDSNAQVDIEKFISELEKSNEQIPTSEEFIPTDREFIIGRWISTDGVFTFLENGDFIFEKQYEPEINTSWSLMDDTLYLGLGKNNSFLKLNILDKNTYYFSYKTDENKEVIDAFRISN